MNHLKHFSYIFIFLLSSSVLFSQEPVQIEGDLEFGNLAFKSLGEDGMIILSRLGDNTITFGSKDRQFVHYDCDMNIVNKVAFSYQRSNMFSHMLFEPVSGATYIVEKLVGSTNFAKLRYNITRIDSEGNTKTAEFKDFTDNNGYRTTTIATSRGLYFLWIDDLSDEQVDALEAEWKATPKDDRGAKLHKVGRQLNLYKFDLEEELTELTSFDIAPYAHNDERASFWQYLDHDETSIRLYEHSISREETETQDTYKVSVLEFDFDGKLKSRYETELSLEGMTVCSSQEWTSDRISSSAKIFNVRYSGDDKSVISGNIYSLASLHSDSDKNIYISFLGQSKTKYWNDKVWSPQKLHLHKFSPDLTQLWTIEKAVSTKLKSTMGTTASLRELRKRVLSSAESVTVQVMADIGVDTYRFNAESGEFEAEKFLKYAKRPFELADGLSGFYTTETTYTRPNEFYAAQLLFDLGLGYMKDATFLKEYNKLSSGSSSSSTAAIKLKNPKFFISSCPDGFMMYHIDSNGANSIYPF